MGSGTETGSQLSGSRSALGSAPDCGPSTWAISPVWSLGCSDAGSAGIRALGSSARSRLTISRQATSQTTRTPTGTAHQTQSTILK